MSQLETSFEQATMDFSQEIEEQSDFMTERERERVNNCFLAWSLSGTVLLSLLNRNSPFIIPRITRQLAQGATNGHETPIGPPSTIHEPYTTSYTIAEER